MSRSDIVLEMKDITKRFPGVLALDRARLELRKGEVHVLLGENGAGKSTLMKVLSGNYRADEGEIFLNGEKVHITDPHTAQKLGISMIHQELLMADNVEVYKNILMGREPAKVPFLGIVDIKKMREEADRILNGELKAGIDVNTITGELSVAQMQLVEIAKSISTGAQIIIMDEPTSSLTGKDIEALFKTIEDLKAKGTTLVYISHKMEEIMRIADRVTIMRDGCYIDTVHVKEATIDEMIAKMVGRELGEKFPKEPVEPGEMVLRVENLCSGDILHDISFTARRGEVLGIFGLIGSGRTELAKAIFGDLPVTGGTVEAFGRPLKCRSPWDAIRNRIGLVPEDRKQEGLVGIMGMAENVTLPFVRTLKKYFLVDTKKQHEIAGEYKDALAVKTPGLDRPVRNLSGGNQQKVVIAKWLATGSEIIILDEPTRGIDVGAKTEIYKIINQLQQKGICIIMISSEMPELLGVSDRILVMKEGRIAKELPHANVDQEEVLKWAL